MPATSGRGRPIPANGSSGCSGSRVIASACSSSRVSTCAGGPAASRACERSSWTNGRPMALPPHGLVRVVPVRGHRARHARSRFARRRVVPAACRVAGRGRRPPGDRGSARRQSGHPEQPGPAACLATAAPGVSGDGVASKSRTHAATTGTPDTTGDGDHEGHAPPRAPSARGGSAMHAALARPAAHACTRRSR